MKDPLDSAGRAFKPAGKLVGRRGGGVDKNENKIEKLPIRGGTIDHCLLLGCCPKSNYMHKFPTFRWLGSTVYIDEKNITSKSIREIHLSAKLPHFIHVLRSLSGLFVS